MGAFFLILALSILVIILCFMGFHSAMGLSLDYWSEKQFAILRWICVGIGSFVFNFDNFSLLIQQG